jgi:hemolysin III
VIEKRRREWRITHPVRGGLHGSAALLSLAVGAHLAALPRGPARDGFLVLALCQAALYAVSALYHSAPWGPRAKRRMQRLDHSMIYVKVGGTLTPFLWLGLEAELRGPLVAAAWGIAAFGILDKALRARPAAPVRAQIAQACLALPALPGLWVRLPGEGSVLLAGAAALYAAGAAIFVSRRPRLWPGVFSFHELFHALLVAASACLYALALTQLV